jgi:integrase
MASVSKPLTIQDEQRGSKIVARILLTDPRSGKRVNRRWSSRTDAETFLAAVEAFGLVEALTFDDNKRGTHSKGPARLGSATRFSTYAEEYLSRKRLLADSTKATYRQRLKAIQATSLGLTPMRDITADHLEAFILALEARRPVLADRTRRGILDFVRAVLGDAFKRGDVPGDVSQHVEQIPINDALKPTILTATDFAAIMAQMPEGWGNFFMFLIQSGCRYGEAMALKWHEMEPDADNPEVTLVHISGGKTMSAQRTTTIPTSLAERLVPNDGPLVFPAAAPDSFRRQWRRAVVAAQAPALVKEGFQPILCSPRVHDLRHTHAVLMLTEGDMNLTALAARLGHSNPQITAAYYAHFSKPQVATLGAVAARAAGGFML